MYARRAARRDGRRAAAQRPDERRPRGGSAGGRTSLADALVVFFGRLATECGYTPDHIREMTMADVLRQFAYWRRSPPPGDLIRVIAHFVGWKPPDIETDGPTFAEAANENAEWFADPKRFFAPGYGSVVSRG